MRFVVPFGRNLARVALLWAATLSTTAFATPEPPTAEDEIIVRGRGYGALRMEIRVAQEAVFARFNDVNNDDAFDIHCTMDSRFGSRVVERRCVSNSWREQDANFARAWLSQAGGGGNAAAYRAEQLRMQRLLKAEMRRLSFEDPQLRAAVLNLGQAMQALQTRTGAQPKWTMFRELPADVDESPFDAEQAFEVRVGLEPWNHYLTESTFTIGEVSGGVREIELDCDQGDLTIRYEPDIEWTVPSGWSGCLLRVHARRGTMFAFYELD